MINNKKKIYQIKTKNFLEKFPIIFLLQHNNFTVNDWFVFKQKINEINVNNKLKNESRNLVNCGDFEILNIKNSLLKNILKSNVNTEQTTRQNLESLCQGPNFIIGCKTDKHLNVLWDCINSNSKLVFISCLYQNQLLNHLDVELLLKTNLSVYKTLLQSLDQKTQIYHLLQSRLNIQPLDLIQHNFLTQLMATNFKN